MGPRRFRTIEAGPPDRPAHQRLDKPRAQDPGAGGGIPASLRDHPGRAGMDGIIRQLIHVFAAARNIRRGPAQRAAGACAARQMTLSKHLIRSSDANSGPQISI